MTTKPSILVLAPKLDTRLPQTVCSKVKLDSCQARFPEMTCSCLCIQNALPTLITTWFFQAPIRQTEPNRLKTHTHKKNLRSPCNRRKRKKKVIEIKGEPCPALAPRLVLTRDALVGPWGRWWRAPALPGRCRAHAPVTIVRVSPSAHRPVFPIRPLPWERRAWNRPPCHAPSSVLPLP